MDVKSSERSMPRPDPITVSTAPDPSFDILLRQRPDPVPCALYALGQISRGAPAQLLARPGYVEYVCWNVQRPARHVHHLGPLACHLGYDGDEFVERRA